MRSCICPWSPALALENTGPQIGISEEPCAAVKPFLRTLDTWSAGNFPLFFIDSCVRLAGGFFQCRGCRAIALAILSMARRAVGNEHFASGSSRGYWCRSLLYFLRSVLREARHAREVHEQQQKGMRSIQFSFSR